MTEEGGNQNIKIYRRDGSTSPYKLTTMTFDVKENGVAIALFATPKNLHSLSPQLRMEMFLILEHAKHDEKVKVIVWSAQGQKSFSSGANLGGAKGIDLDEEIFLEYYQRGMAPNLKSDNAFVQETLAFWDFPKPIIGAINGIAVGGGANIALCNYFDLVLCSTNAKFKYPFADLGFTPELGSSLMLPLTAGLHRAKQVMYTGDWFSAQDAMDWGLVTAIHQPDDLMPQAIALASKIATKETNQLMLSKKVLNSYLRKDLHDVLRRENETILASLQHFGGKQLVIQQAMKLANKKKGKSEKSKL